MTRLQAAGIALAISAGAPTAFGADTGARINLTCAVSGTTSETRSAVANAWDSNGNYTSGVVNRRVDVPFSDQLQLWVESDAGAIRVPRQMLPTFHGGDNGWFKLKAIVVTPDEITATIAINFMNSPKLRLDRVAGTISVSGSAGNFAGNCSKYDPATVNHAF